MSNLEKTVDLISEKDLSKEQKAAAKLVLNKKQNIFIQGSAGSGKSTFIKYLQVNSNKNIVLCSPTAIAALNIGGTTLHSLFRLPIMDFITDDRLFKANRKNVISVIQSMQILIIDEISMVRPDILDAVDKVCKRIRGNSKVPFGGVQVILIGDLYQLPPVINKSTIKVFEEEYGTNDPYFFDAHVYKEADFKNIQFTKIFRQTDKELLNNLNNIRNMTSLSSTIKYFNSCKIKDKKTLDYAVIITPYKDIADKINKAKLDKIKDKEVQYRSELEGVFEKMSESAYPAPKVLKLKVGAMVIFNKNDKDKQWINGSVGIIEELERAYIVIRLLSSNKTVIVGKDEWENKEYNTEYVEEEDPKTHLTTLKKKIIEKVTGTFKQYPLQLGYSMTIHKAQGKTLDKVSIDLDRGAFAHGQLYVALSRTRRKEDINMLSSISERDVIFDKRIREFLNTISKKTTKKVI